MKEPRVIRTLAAHSGNIGPPNKLERGGCGIYKCAASRHGCLSWQWMAMVSNMG